MLSTPVDVARAAVERPNGPETWNALQAELAAELQHGQNDAYRRSAGARQAELDDAGVPWVPRLGGRAKLGPELAQTARTGKWDRARHAGRSEARMAILCAAAARGWRLAECGQRSPPEPGGFAGLYERPSEPGRLERLLPLSGENRSAFVAGEKTCVDGSLATITTPPHPDRRR